MSHYKSEYFNWQKNIGSFGASVDLFKFVDEIKSDDKVIDFGSGGGYVLAHLECKEKIGVNKPNR